MPKVNSHSRNGSKKNGTPGKGGEKHSRKAPAKNQKRDDDSGSDTQYAVEKIMDHKGKAGHRKMLVRWSGYGEEEDSWENESSLREDIPQKVTAFLKRKNISPVSPHHDFNLNLHGSAVRDEDSRSSPQV